MSVFIFIFSSILAISTFFLTLVFLFYNLGGELEAEQKIGFVNTVSVIRKLVSMNDSYNKLDSFRNNGYIIIVYDSEGNNIYPTREISNNKEEFLDFKNDFHTVIEANNHKIFISSPMKIDTATIQKCIKKTFPVVLLLVCILIVIGSGLCNYLYKKEKKKLDFFFKKMKQEVKYETLLNVDSHIVLDDYYQLENNVLDLYKQLQTSQRQIKTEMKEVKKLEIEKNAVLEGFTHEMKNPIMSSQLLLANLRTASLSKEELDQLLAAENELNKLQYLIKDILFVFHNKQVNKYKKINVSIVIRKLIQDYEVLWNDKLMSFELKVIQEFTFFYNEKIIEKIFSNLLSNAIIYSPDKSVIYIEINDSQITIENDINYSDEIDIDKVTSPFFSHGDEGGTGLGLYLVSLMLQNSNYDYEFSCGKKFISSIYKKNNL